MQNYSAILSKWPDTAFSLALNYLDHDGLVENTNSSWINTRISSNYHYLDNRLHRQNVAINRWTQTSPRIDENAISILPRRFMMRMVIITMPSDVLGDAPNMARLLENEKQNKDMIIGVSLVMHSLKLNRLRTWCWKPLSMNYYGKPTKLLSWHGTDEVNKLTNHPTASD